MGLTVFFGEIAPGLSVTLTGTVVDRPEYSGTAIQFDDFPHVVEVGDGAKGLHVILAAGRKGTLVTGTVLAVYPKTVLVSFPGAAAPVACPTSAILIVE